MVDPARKDNVVKFRQIKRTPPPGAPKPAPGAGLRGLAAGRESLLWWALIVLVAIGVTAWQFYGPR